MIRLERIAAAPGPALRVTAALGFCLFGHLWAQTRSGPTSHHGSPTGQTLSINCPTPAKRHALAAEVRLHGRASHVHAARGGAAHQLRTYAVMVAAGEETAVLR